MARRQSPGRAQGRSQGTASQDGSTLKDLLDQTLGLLDRAAAERKPKLQLREIGAVKSIGHGIALVSGLPGVGAEELVFFSGQVPGLVFNVQPGELGVILLGQGEGIAAGSEVRRTGRTVDVPVGEALLGRVVDALGRPLDDGGPIRAAERRQVEREAPAIMDRAPVSVPLQTGIKVIDALIPIGRGQRELILGDRQTGKTAIAVDTILNQSSGEMICVYCAIGKRGSAVARVIEDLRAHQALAYSIVVVAEGDDPPGLQYVAPYAATSMAEYFMEQGRDALIVYDDLALHARAYRELSLLLRRPPGREAYPGDIFYIHSRLLERSTRLNKEHGGGSLTALPIIETEAQNLSAYIPTNLISITDGQVYLSPELFRKGVLPAVDVGKSVSRVGGKTQLAAYRAVAGDLRLAYSQFEELESFARFGTRLDQDTRRILERGRRVREILKQPQYAPLPVVEQIAALMAVNEGVFDGSSPEEIAGLEETLRGLVRRDLPELGQRIERGEKLTDQDREAMLEVLRAAVPPPPDEGPEESEEASPGEAGSAQPRAAEGADAEH